MSFQTKMFIEFDEKLMKPLQKVTVIFRRQPKNDDLENSHFVRKYFCDKFLFFPSETSPYIISEFEWDFG